MTIMKNKRRTAVAKTMGTKGSPANEVRSYRPGVDSVWEACREVRDATALRKRQEADTEKSAALKLGFAQNENHRWTATCPICECEVKLYTAPNGHVRASSSNPNCAAVPEIQIQLRKWGLQ